MMFTFSVLRRLSLRMIISSECGYNAEVMVKKQSHESV